MNSSSLSSQERVWTAEFIFIFFLSLSYFYCLPLLRTGVILGVTASEVRLYDVIFVIGLLFIVGPKLNAVFSRWSRYSKAHKYLLYWLIIGFIGLFITIFYNENRFLIGLIRYFRFFAFSVVFVLGFMFITNRKQLVLLFDALVVAIAVISLIGTLQGLGMIPNLWPDYYSIYFDFEGGYLSTATLAPNHTHYSLIMAFGIIMVFTRLTISFRLSFLSIFLLASTIPMLYSMIASRGRSGWLVLAVYLLANIFMARNVRGFILAAFVVGGIFLLIEKNVGAGDSSVEDILLYRSINTHKQLGRTALDVLQEDDRNWIERVDDNRWVIYERSVTYLLDNPKYFLIGAGFQNAIQGIGRVALNAHNAYINIIAEHGIFGFFIYGAFLYHLYRFAVRIRGGANNRASRVLSTNWICMYFGLIVVNFFGEVIYPGRALFTFLGTFFIVAVLFLHPAWRTSLTDPKYSA